MSYTAKEIWESSWLEPTACQFLNIGVGTPPHVIIERILLNVSISFESNWKDVWKAEPTDNTQYKALIISLILIDKHLANFCGLSTLNRRSLLGERNWLVLQQYQTAS